MQHGNAEIPLEIKKLALKIQTMLPDDMAVCLAALELAKQNIIDFYGAVPLSLTG